ncbi:MAG: DUF4445 domain-containing protein [Desulfurococcales archaeon]|nr:DUF4445 domain-containing protein [Desulfurococcales archaeon]
MDQVKITIPGHGVYIAPKGVNLGRFLASKKLLPLPCGGRGLCGQCIVRIIEGEVSSPTVYEKLRPGIGGEYRLACQTRVLGDTVVELIYKPRLVVPRYSIEIAIEEPKPIYRLIPYREVLTSYKELLLSSSIEGDLGGVISFNRVAVAGVREECMGEINHLLVDLGTTKIAYQIVDNNAKLVREGIVLNPLLSYGSDIITRLTKAVESRKAAIEMYNELNKTLPSLARENKCIGLCMVAGNSVMESLFLKMPLNTLAEKPFQPYLRGPFLHFLANNIPCLVAPLISGFVGGDAFADLALAEYLKTPTPYMIIDLGTNTEVILVASRNPVEVYVTSAPAGPAFEGHITAGSIMGAGGIERIWLKGFNDRGEAVFEYRGSPTGLLGSGVVSLVAEIVRNKLVDKRGRIVKGYRVVNGIKSFAITERPRPIVFTQIDLREFQKAMAAVKTSWKMLLDKAGCDPGDLRIVYIGGTFGSFIDPLDAMLLGLVPPIELSSIVVAGNMVLPGLKTLLFNRKHYKYMLELLPKIRHVNLAEEKDFMNKWIKNLEFNALD